MDIKITNDAETVAKMAATFIANEARAAIRERGRFVMAVSGGKTPWIMLRHLADEKVEWDNVHLFQVDERVAPAGSADRNWTHLQESLLSKTETKSVHLYPMPVESSALESGASSYATLLNDLTGTPPVFDLVHLGLGPDGHTASLTPGDPVLKVIDRDVALTGLYQGHQRMTLTYPVINRSRKILWVVTGKEKQTALQQLLNKEKSIPGGSIVQAHATILADADAAAALAEKKFPLKVGIAADHGGFELKADLIKRLLFSGYEVTDFGANELCSTDDYPDYGIPLGEAVVSGKVDRGIAICGSGVGINVCMNKVRGIRAALINDHFSARQGVEDDHINVICLGGRTIGHEVAWDLVQTFLTSSYSEEKRHLRRIGKVAALEK
ncbi:MAG: 6-phosphogluconolactonase [Chthoniobacterales bacterium]|nr:6-phosphogluconolactonase [Chthoniobacterales bacterium]